jgi:hypothetical protein
VSEDDLFERVVTIGDLIGPDAKEVLSSLDLRFAAETLGADLREANLSEVLLFRANLTLAHLNVRTCTKPT